MKTIALIVYPEYDKEYDNIRDFLALDTTVLPILSMSVLSVYIQFLENVDFTIKETKIAIKNPEYHLILAKLLYIQRQHTPIESELKKIKEDIENLKNIYKLKETIKHCEFLDEKFRNGAC